MEEDKNRALQLKALIARLRNDGHDDEADVMRAVLNMSESLESLKLLNDTEAKDIAWRKIWSDLALVETGRRILLAKMFGDKALMEVARAFVPPQAAPIRREFFVEKDGVRATFIYEVPADGFEAKNIKRTSAGLQDLLKQLHKAIRNEVGGSAGRPPERLSQGQLAYFEYMHLLIQRAKQNIKRGISIPELDAQHPFIDPKIAAIPKAYLMDLLFVYDGRRDLREFPDLVEEMTREEPRRLAICYLNRKFFGLSDSAVEKRVRASLRQSTQSNNTLSNVLSIRTKSIKKQRKA